MLEGEKGFNDSRLFPIYLPQIVRLKIVAKFFYSFKAVLRRPDNQGNSWSKKKTPYWFDNDLYEIKEDEEDDG